MRVGHDQPEMVQTLLLRQGRSHRRCIGQLGALERGRVRQTHHGIRHRLAQRD